MGVMKDETLRELIRSGIEYADHVVSFAFQGGEPTLAGLEFFERVIRYQEQYLKESGKKDLHIHNAIQTNGFLIDEKWAAFFTDTISSWGFHWMDRQMSMTATGWTPGRGHFCKSHADGGTV